MLTNLTSSEWAAWVQAIGSIAAIGGAAWIAIWQSRKQQAVSLVVLREELRLSQIEAARTLMALSTNCLNAMKQIAAQFVDREAVHRIAAQEVHFDFNGLRIIEGAVQSIPLHSLPHALVSLTMIVSSTVRQFREKVESDLRFHREMDSAAFADFFSTIQQMQNSLTQTVRDIETVVRNAENAG